MRISRQTQGSGLGPLAARVQRRETAVAAGIGGLCVDVIKARAFGARGRQTSSKTHPPGVDLIHTDQMRKDYRVIAIRKAARSVLAHLGVKGKAAAYSDSVQRRWPWQALSKADMKRVRKRSPGVTRKALGLTAGLVR